MTEDEARNRIRSLVAKGFDIDTAIAAVRKYAADQDLTSERAQGRQFGPWKAGAVTPEMAPLPQKKPDIAPFPEDAPEPADRGLLGRAWDSTKNFVSATGHAFGEALVPGAHVLGEMVSVPPGAPPPMVQGPDGTWFPHADLERMEREKPQRMAELRKREAENPVASAIGTIGGIVTAAPENLISEGVGLVPAAGKVGELLRNAAGAYLSARAGTLLRESAKGEDLEHANDASRQAAKTAFGLGAAGTAFGQASREAAGRGATAIAEPTTIRGQYVKALDRPETKAFLESPEAKALPEGVRGVDVLAQDKGMELAQKHKGYRATSKAVDDYQMSQIPGLDEPVPQVGLFRDLNSQVDRYSTSRRAVDPGLEQVVENVKANLSGTRKQSIDPTKATPVRPRMGEVLETPITAKRSPVEVQDFEPNTIQAPATDVAPAVEPFPSNKRVYKPTGERTVEHRMGTRPAGEPRVDRYVDNPQELGYEPAAVDPNNYEIRNGRPRHFGETVSQGEDMFGYERAGDDVTVGYEPGQKHTRPFASWSDLLKQRQVLKEKSGLDGGQSEAATSAFKAYEAINNAIDEAATQGNVTAKMIRARDAATHQRLSSIENADKTVFGSGNATRDLYLEKTERAYKPEAAKVAKDAAMVLRQALFDTRAGGDAVRQLDGIRNLSPFHRQVVEALEAKVADEATKWGLPKTFGHTGKFASALVEQNANYLMVRKLLPLLRQIEAGDLSGLDLGGKSARVGEMITGARSAERRREEDNARKLREMDQEDEEPKKRGPRPWRPGDLSE